MPVKLTDNARQVSMNGTGSQDQQSVRVKKKGEGHRVIRKLRMEQLIRLSEWMASRAAEFKESCPTYAEVARMATGELGFGISDSSVREVAKVKGIDWKPYRRSVEDVDRRSSTSEKVNVLIHDIQELWEVAHTSSKLVDSLECEVRAVRNQIERVADNVRTEDAALSRMVGADIGRIEKRLDSLTGAFLDLLQRLGEKDLQNNLAPKLVE